MGAARSSDLDHLRKAGKIFVAIGLTLLVCGVWMLVDTARFVARASSAPGTVIAVREVSVGEDDKAYRLVVRFTRLGAEETFESRFGSGSPQSVGSSVEVLYVPGEEPRIHSFAGLWLAPGMLGLLGGAFCGFGRVAIRYAGGGRAGRDQRGAYIER